MRALTAVVALAIGLLASGSGIAAASNYQGLWWNPQQSGWGINFAHQGDIVFATWFTYDGTGKPWWLIALLSRTAEGVYSGPVSTVAGPLFNSAPFGPAPVETEVGTMTATFADASHATIQYTVNGVTQTKAIVPQQFGPLPTCAWGAQPNLALATNYQDLWWNPQESGWGVNFTHQGDVIFATWFTYDATGKPWWLIALLSRTVAGVYAGPVSTVAGPPFDAVPWSAVAETGIGSATATFADGNSATFAYTVNGVAQTKSITRQVFAPPGTVCTAPAVPTATAAGVPDGSAVGATIGAAGGSVGTADGRLVVTIPPGALAADTVIGIQSLTNLAHGRIGAAYRLTPNGQTFAKPVTLKFSYTDEDLLGTAAEFLGAAFQTAAGYWQWLGAAAVDTVAKTASVGSSHFTDISLVKGLQIRPKSKTVKPKASVALHVRLCYVDNSDSGDELASLGFDCDLDQGPDGILTVDDWSVNGQAGGNGTVGTVAGANETATYTAPSTVPNPHIVAVSARTRVQQIGGSALVVSKIAIVGESWSGTAAGTLTSTVIVETGTAAVTWTLHSMVDNVAVYRPTGTVSATISFVGCVGARLDPSSHTLNPSTDGTLTIDYNLAPPAYHGAGLSQWSATLICDTGGSTPGYGGQVDFFGGSGGAFGTEAAGTVSPDGVTIEGSDSRPIANLGQQSFHWKFTRNP